MKTFKEVAHLFMGCKINTSINGTIMNGYWYDRIINGDCDALPILIPLSAITDEHRDAIGGFSNLIVESEEGAIQAMALATDYLISKRYDVFNWIELSEAIDATTLNPNPYTI